MERTHTHTALLSFHVMSRFLCDLVGGKKDLMDWTWLWSHWFQILATSLANCVIIKKLFKLPNTTLLNGLPITFFSIWSSEKFRFSITCLYFTSVKIKFQISHANWLWPTSSKWYIWWGDNLSIFLSYFNSPILSFYIKLILWWHFSTYSEGRIEFYKASLSFQWDKILVNCDQ